MIDVIYLLPLSQKLIFLKACYSSLKPGGVLLVKEISQTHSWKSRLTVFQEFLAVKVLGITEGEEISLVSEANLVSLIVEAGFEEPDVKQIDRGYPHLHTLFLTKKP